MSTISVNIPLTSPEVVSPTSAPRPLQLIDGNLPSALTSPTSRRASKGSAHGLGLSTPPPSARAFKPANPRRQSSISYFPSDHVSLHETRSPANCRSSARRTQSMGVWDEDLTGLSRLKGDRRSMPAGGPSEPHSPRPAVDHGPLTLTEKHADLLQFIAQKEAKCLELRSQLAVHERELAELKRKWERIVSRGMDRAYSSPATVSASTAHTSNHPHSAVSSFIPSANAALKEGVRLLAAGLELSSTPSRLPSSPILSPPALPISGFATVSRASMAAMKAHSMHASTLSVSSVSTAATSASATQSQRLSQSSASSLTSSFSMDDVLEEEATVKMNTTSIPEETCAEPIVPVEVLPSHSSKLLRRRSYENEESTSLPSPMSPRSEATAKLTGQYRTRTHSAAVDSNSVLSTPVASLMNTVGRKWEEIQRGNNFTKSQKRASLLLSDVSQSIFAALSSPTQASPSAMVASPRTPSSKLQHSTLPRSASLLEEDLEFENEKQLGAVLLPSVLSPTPAPAAAHTHAQKQSKTLDDDDDWNW